MVNITLSVPDELKSKMDGFNEINWSAVARNAISEKISDLELFNKFTEKSEITEKDAIKWGKELNRRMAKEIMSKELKLVIDANILFSALIKEGKSTELILSKNLTLYAPEFLLSEFIKFESEIIRKTKRSKREFQQMYAILTTRIKPISTEVLASEKKIAKSICPDPNDIEYFTIALHRKCPIWSNDKELKRQSMVHIITTTELINHMNT